MTFEFEEENIRSSGFQSRNIMRQPQTPSMVKWLVKSGVVKNDAVGGKVLLIIACTFFVVTIFVIGYFVLDIRPGRNSPQNSYERMTPEQWEKLSPQIRDRINRTNQNE